MSGAGAGERGLLPALNVAAVVLIMALDAATPAGVVVGMLASLPIIGASFTDSRAQVWLTFWVAVAGFALAAAFGKGPVTPEHVWLPNRIFAFLALPASCSIALMLQAQRLEAVRARDAAVAAGELNRLLTALLAHDLRSPLMLAVQGFGYLQDMVAAGEPPDPAVVSELRGRLQRSLHTIEAVLALARAELGTSGAGPAAQPTDVAAEVREEVASFAAEAAARKKTLVAELEGVGGRGYRTDVRVLRQGLAILLDNAIRHAVPGPVWVSAEAGPGELVLRVADCGSSGAARRPAGRGAGLGLELCRALAEHAGGTLEAERQARDGSSFVLRIPAEPVPVGRAAGRGQLLPGLR